MTPRVVAFDLSLTSTGVADQNGTRRIRSKKTGEERLIEIRDAVLQACGFAPIVGILPDLVVIEGFSYGSKGSSTVDIGGMGWIVRVALYEAGIPYEVVSPSTIKIFACGKGNAKKDDVLLAAVRRLDYQGNSGDEADALWLYALAMHALGSPIVTLPQTHLRALDSVKWSLASAQ
jgi:crossover junction endodeoxyribonuclease RuvC